MPEKHILAPVNTELGSLPALTNFIPLWDKTGLGSNAAQTKHIPKGDCHNRHDTSGSNPSMTNSGEGILGFHIKPGQFAGGGLHFFYDGIIKF
jgi:hypothetical protein